MRNQQTIKNMVQCQGIGLHHGENVKIQLMPAPPDTGIVFIREFDNKSIYIDAHVNNVFNTFLSTSLGAGYIHVHTIEHIMAACIGSNIDNLYIIMNSHEVPIMDGSSVMFANIIKEAEKEKQNKLRSYIKITEEIEVISDNQSIKIVPSNDYSIDYTINFPHPVINNQSLTFSMETDSFYTDIAPARTFCRFEDIEEIKQMGMAKGGSLDNAIVLGDDGVLNKQGLRYEDEFVRHKILDLIGDLSLIGVPVIGHITAIGSGHNLNVEFAKEILKRKDKWEVVVDPLLPIAPKQAAYSYCV